MEKTNWTRLSELDHLDSIGTRVADEIKRHVGDKDLFNSTAMKVARAMVERKISPTRVGQICDKIVIDRRTAKKIQSPGKYFVRSVQREFASAGISWESGHEANDDV